jgi:ring-1,2-phenylacetyl-CoA epoxidase subunit PaaA
MVTDAEVLERIRQGGLIESVDEMSEAYREALRVTLIVSGDTELLSAPAYYHAAQQAPSVNAYISLMAIIQDELGHAHIAYRILEDIGVDVEQLIYERPPSQWKYPYAFDVPLKSWAEMVVANAFYDRAGYKLLGDVYHHTSYGPWKRALAKVDKEEIFHVRHGEMWMRRLARDPDGRAELQRAVDWMFPLTVEWFGLPDDLKRHPAQLTFRIKGLSNDQLRQSWLREVVPFCESIGIRVPAHYDSAQDKYVLDYPLPCEFDPEEKRWHFDRPCTWDDVLRRWKQRGPYNEVFVEQVRQGYRQLRAWQAAAQERFEWA